MFQKRIDKVKELKPVTIQWKNQTVTIKNFAALQQLMKEAVESDLVNVNVTPGGSNNIRAQTTQVEQLKAEIFRAYLSQTKDFEESIYGDGQEPVEPTATPEVKPTATPNVTPGTTEAPEVKPTATPTATPGVKPSATPNVTPEATEKPEVKPTATPVVTPEASASPEKSPEPTEKPNETPGATEKPGVKPSATPSDKPSVQPPVDIPTSTPGNMQTAAPGTDSVLPDGDDDNVLEEGALKSELLIAKVSTSKTSQIIRWNSVKSADGYYIYGAKANGKYKCLRTVSKKVLRWKRTGLKKGTLYRYYVEAYKLIDGKRVSLSKSLPAYSTTKGGKYGNPVKLQTKPSLVSVKSGKKIKLNVKAAGKKMNKASKKVRYISANPSIAKVSKKGIVTGGRRGTCYVYCVAWNGLSKKIKVRVK